MIELNTKIMHISGMFKYYLMPIILTSKVQNHART